MADLTVEDLCEKYKIEKPERRDISTKPYVPPREPGKIITGRVKEVLDGDTAIVVDDKTKKDVTIRLHGIDAPEIPHGSGLGQSFGYTSKAALSEAVEGYPVSVEITGTDKYGRSIGIISKDNVNINLKMVQKGYAWAEPYFLDQAESKVYVDAQTAAQDLALGLWVEPFPTQPSDYRYEEKLKVYNAQLFAEGKKQEIVIPAWNDIIHLTAPPSYSSYERATINDVWTRYNVIGWTPPRIAEYLDMPVEKVLDYISKYRELQEYAKKKLDAAINMSKSPTPSLAFNFGTIMTALDDLQDFTTTVGVISRILGRVFKPAELLAIGAFTVGEFLNRLTQMNKLTGAEKSIICKLVKQMKHSSRWSTIKEDVDHRMKKLFPTQGELCEIAQTTDQLFGVGISLGPIVGLAEDLMFGLVKGTPIRFKEWTISAREKAVLKNIADRFVHPEKGFEMAFHDIARWAESAANIVTTGDYHEWNEFATGLVTTIYTGVATRCTKVKDAVKGIWEYVTGKKASTRKHTKTETKFLMQRLGIDPARQDAWPIEGLGQTATIQEIMDAYSRQANKVLQFWRSKLGVSDEGLFLDACVREIGLHASAMFCSDDGVIHESLDPSVLIYIHALENNLQPPPETSTEAFKQWHDYISERMQYYDIDSPTLSLLREGHSKFFGC